MVTIALNDLKSIDSLKRMIEDGETCIITDKGSPIAEIFPLKPKKNGWKTGIKRVKLAPGITAAEIIREERDLT